MHFKRITVNKYKNINNEISIDFQKATKQRNIDDCFITTDDDKLNKRYLLNKLSLFGNISMGKSNFLSAIANLKELGNIRFEELNNYKLNKTNFIKEQTIQSIDKLYNTEYKLELTDGSIDCEYKIHQFNEEIIFTVPGIMEPFTLTIDDIRSILEIDGLLLNDISYYHVVDFINIIENTQKDDLICSFLRLMNVKFKFYRGYFKFNRVYTNEDFENSILRRLFITLNGIHLLNASNNNFSGSNENDSIQNKHYILNRLLVNNDAFERIKRFLIKFTPEILSLDIKMVEDRVKVVLNDNLDLFNDGSASIVKLFSILSFLEIVKEKNSSLVLVDGIDVNLLSGIVVQLLRLDFWKDRQIILTLTNSSVFYSRFKIFRNDQINFIRYKKENSFEREIVRLSDYEGNEKFIRNNKMQDALFTNEFKLASWANYLMEADEKEE